MLVILYRHENDGLTWYYTLDDRQSQLFDRFSLTVRWGRSPEGGRQKHYVFDTLEEKNRMIRTLMGRKLKTHKVLYSWFRDKQDAMPATSREASVNGSRENPGPALDSRHHRQA